MYTCIAADKIINLMFYIFFLFYIFALNLLYILVNKIETREN